MVRTENSVMLSRDEYKALANAVLNKAQETDRSDTIPIVKLTVRVSRVEALFIMEQFLFEGGENNA